MPWLLLAALCLPAAALDGRSARPPEAAAHRGQAAPPGPPDGVHDEDLEYGDLGIDGKEPLPRFLVVSTGIYRSGQPNREGLARLAGQGVKTVLSLRYWMAAGERQEVRRLGMRSAEVRMRGYRFPDFAEVDRAIAALADPRLRPIVVHCKHGRDRTGTVVAAYRLVHEGVDVKTAAAEAKGIGCCPWVGDVERWLEAYKRHREGKPPAPGGPAGREAIGLPSSAREAGGAASDGGGTFDGSSPRAVWEPVAFPGRGRPPQPGSLPRPAASPRPPSGGPPAPEGLTRARRGALARRAVRVLEGNRQSFALPGGTVRFTAPDRDRYPYQWLWDSAFHALGLRHVDPQRAADELRSLLRAQWPDGMIPNMVHVRPDILRGRERSAAWKALKGGRPIAAAKRLGKAAKLWLEERLLGVMHNPKTHSSGITQPPILAEAALAVAEKLSTSEARTFLQDVYPGLRRYYDWIGRTREQDGLMVVYHSWETGADNSPRFDPVYGQKPGRFKEAWFNLTRKLPAIRAFKRSGWSSSERFAAKSVDMNSYYAQNLDALAAISRRAGDEGSAAGLEARAGAVRKMIREQLWDEKAGGFRDLGKVKGAWTRLETATPFDFLPLYAGVLDPKDPRVRELAGQLTDPARFWTRFPVPTVSRLEPSFDPDAYWRGTSWVNVNYFLARGLAANGYKDEARTLVARTLEMVERGGFREYFNPDSAEGHRAKNLSWTAALVLELDRMLDDLDKPSA